MNKKFLVMLVAVFLPFIGAEIILEDTFNSVYSFSDMVEANFSLSKQIDSTGYLETYLDCGAENVLVGKQYVEIDANEKRYFGFEFPANNKGDCVFEVRFDSETAKSEEFKVSSNVDITYSISSKSVFPGEKVSFNGTAKKANGNFLEGVVSVVAGTFIDRTYEVDNGAFNGSFEVPQDAPAGKVKVYIEAVEKNEKEETINSGKISFDLEVKSQPRNIVLDSSESVNPPENFTIDFMLVDQSGNLVENETVLMKVFDPLKNIVYESSFPSKGSYVYFFDGDSLRGAWDFNFYFGSIFSGRQVFVGENPEVSALVVYDSGKSYIRITNEGNVPYQGVVSVTLFGNEGEVEVPVNVDLGVGEHFDYLLNYEGDYNLSFQGEDLGQFALTGAAVGLDLDLSSESYWGFFIVVFLLIVGYFGYKGRRKISTVFKRKKKGPVEKNVSKGGKVPLYEGVFKSKAESFTGTRAYIAFFNFEKFFEEANFLASKNGWTFRKVGEGVYFILFYSKDKISEEKLLKFVKQIFLISKKKGLRVSASIHADRLEKKEDFLKEFSTLGKRLLNYSKNEVLVSRNFFYGLEGYEGRVRYYELDNEILEAYSIRF